MYKNDASTLVKKRKIMETVVQSKFAVESQTNQELK